MDSLQNLDSLLFALKDVIERLYKEISKILDDQNSISEILFEDNSGYAIIDPNRSAINSQPKAQLSEVEAPVLSSQPKESVNNNNLNDSLNDITLMDGATGNTSDFSNPLFFSASEENINLKSSLHPAEFKVPNSSNFFRERADIDGGSVCFEGIDMSMGNLSPNKLQAEIKPAATNITTSTTATKPNNKEVREKNFENLSFNDSFLSIFSSQESIPLNNSASINNAEVPKDSNAQISKKSPPIIIPQKRTNNPAPTTTTAPIQAFQRTEPWRQVQTKETLERLKKSKFTLASGFRNLDRKVQLYFKNEEISTSKTEDFLQKFNALKLESNLFESNLKNLEIGLNQAQLQGTGYNPSYKTQLNELQSAFNNWGKFVTSLENLLIRGGGVNEGLGDGDSGKEVVVEEDVDNPATKSCISNSNDEENRSPTKRLKII
ncbi:hypothetical protein CONCODRAFT_91873 [Conidiobolus coronatus NRRL 28638]|uniref:Uncharacterized protein n=1 Tax=Conidiobolus coronatus (strain ATCC 28846 / CBS 209.66 / NRRL 28638) TaxID=796925 RepID=A0A137P4C9_CONC2|nr:hypothetical protein CONCODRAFT_91873 [Conidiobolus coronatus NRRL 28638]|eukprot:KXN69781.1 hypothetical protein CONCODRAFT_91873 [Conidiobolus coronatus NRRL 28638]